MGGSGSTTSTTGNIDPLLRPLFQGSGQGLLNYQAQNPLTGFSGDNPMGVAQMSPAEQYALSQAYGFGQADPMMGMALQNITNLPSYAYAGPTTGDPALNDLGLQDMMQLFSRPQGIGVPYGGEGSTEYPSGMGPDSAIPPGYGEGIPQPGGGTLYPRQEAPGVGQDGMYMPGGGQDGYKSAAAPGGFAAQRSAPSPFSVVGGEATSSVPLQSQAYQGGFQYDAQGNPILAGVAYTGAGHEWSGMGGADPGTIANRNAIADALGADTFNGYLGRNERNQPINGGPSYNQWLQEAYRVGQQRMAANQTPEQAANAARGAQMAQQNLAGMNIDAQRAKFLAQYGGQQGAAAQRSAQTPAPQAAPAQPPTRTAAPRVQAMPQGGSGFAAGGAQAAGKQGVGPAKAPAATGAPAASQSAGAPAGVPRMPPIQVPPNHPGTQVPGGGSNPGPGGRTNPNNPGTPGGSGGIPPRPRGNPPTGAPPIWVGGPGQAALEQASQAQAAQGGTTGATPFGQSPGIQAGYQRVSGEGIQNDPAIAAAQRDFMKRVAPGIQNSAGLAGLGNSTAMVDALADAQAGMMTPLYQDAFAREQHALDRGFGSVESELDRRERAGVRRAEGVESSIDRLLALSNMYSGRQAQGIDMLSGLGGTQRGIEQQGNESSYNDFLRQQALSESALYQPFGGMLPSAFGSRQTSSGK